MPISASNFGRRAEAEIEYARYGPDTSVVGGSVEQCLNRRRSSVEFDSGVIFNRCGLYMSEFLISDRPC